MAIKKSELYSSLWKACDELRGGMDSSQYKDYVLVLLFIKYVSDKYAGKKDALVEIPKGASFQDMISLKGKSDIGDQINKKILIPIADANDLSNIKSVDFNDETKLGKGKDMVDRLSNLVSIFETPEVDFSKNKAEGDDILGDAYEYLMRHFATESGKSKGQFYTPSEVSRVMAKVIGISSVKSQDQTIYDPTCGSGSLLLKAVDEAPIKVTIYGQEMESTTAGLAKMNMYIHNNETAQIVGGDSTLSKPSKFGYSGVGLKTFDFIVANPPFSSKSWRNGFLPEQDEFKRFEDGVPPTKNGDYAFLLHIIKSLNQKGKGAVILPHGVLFRGNAEGEIRKNLIKKGYIKGIIGLPANLFYGTGIPACIIVLDKEHAQSRKGIFMIDASKGFVKDGNKNRLRHQDIHKIVDVFNKHLEIEKYSRMVSISEIEKNDFNLNIPRYVDTQEEEDLQNIEAHLMGGIPNKDIDDLDKYFEIMPNVKKELFEPNKRKGFTNIKIDINEVKSKILESNEFKEYKKDIEKHFEKWKKTNIERLNKIGKGVKPKDLISQISEELLTTFSDVKLIDKYDMYQHLLSYWSDIMQDDLYIISIDGFNAEVYRVIEKDKKGKEKDKGWACDLIPKELVITKYFNEIKNNLLELQSELESINQEMTELQEEQTGDEGLLLEVLSEKGTISKGNITKRIKELLKDEANNTEELAVLNKYLGLLEKESNLKGEIKTLEEELDKKLLKKYKELTENEIKILVIEGKWMKTIQTAVKDEIDNITQKLTQRIKELALRYENTLPELQKESNELEKAVEKHLQKMGFKY